MSEAFSAARRVWDAPRFARCSTVQRIILNIGRLAGRIADRNEEPERRPYETLRKGHVVCNGTLPDNGDGAPSVSANAACKFECSTNGDASSEADATPASDTSPAADAS